MPPFIRSRMELDVQPLLNVIGFAESLDEIAADIGQEAADEIAPMFLDELRTEPGEPPPGFVWSSNPSENASARGWWFAAVRDGRVPTDGRHYIRSHKLVEAWNVQFERASLRFFVENRAQTADGRALAPLVVGSFDRRRGLGRQLPGHARIWQPAAPTVDFWMEAFQERVSEKFGALVPAEYGALSLRRRNR